MRKSLVSTLAALLFTTAWNLSAQAPLINDIEVKLDFAETPKLAAENVTSSPGGVGTQKWLEVAIVYTMPSKLDPRTKQMEWLDEMSIEVQIIMPAEYEGKAVPALLSGRQVFWSVPCDGKKHRASLFVPPMILSRYAKSDFKTNKSAAKDLAAAALFKTKMQTMIARAFHVPRRSSQDAVLRDFQATEKSLGILRLEDTVLPREKTPWQWLDVDSYDLPKLSGSK